jgi:hypothetical protein
VGRQGNIEPAKTSPMDMDLGRALQVPARCVLNAVPSPTALPVNIMLRAAIDDRRVAVIFRGEYRSIGDCL